MPRLKLQDKVPEVIQNVNAELDEDMKACFLAESLSKRQFQRTCRNSAGINCPGVMREISAHVSSIHPLPQDAFPWSLTKHLISGLLKVRLYTLDNGVAEGRKCLKGLESAVDIQKVNEPWILPEVPREPPAIEDIIMDPKFLSHIAEKDIFQIEEVEHFREDINQATNFGALTDEELSIYTSNDWLKAIEEQEERLRAGKQLRCIHPGTPKRKKVPSPEDNGSPPLGTPSKRPRNLDDQYPETARAEKTTDIPDLGTTDDLAVPLPDVSSDPKLPWMEFNDIQLPPDQTGPGEVPALPAPAELSPVASPRPRSRIRPRPTQLANNYLMKRIANIRIDTVPLVDRVINPRKVQNDVSMLFKHPATSWSSRQRTPMARVLAQNFSRHLRVIPRGEIDDAFQEFLESRQEEEHVPVDPSVPEAPAFPEPPVDDVPMAEIVENHETTREACKAVASKDFAFRQSEISSGSKKSRSTDKTSELCSQPVGMTRREFHEALDAKWKEIRDNDKFTELPAVDFDEVINPKERTRLDYTQAISYAMDAMMKNELIIKQAQPFGVVWLLPVPSRSMSRP
ncbi:uncharacterized protein LOC135163422 isoform X2 [Diachasmimorpha longicaudata]|uniref:uncharacterized protein LOC135163422 isoform X2 n=1 Tax=Diachasmimorpha longicaudata TaxID=58733 RepID=UPI0030B8AC92